MKNKMNKKGIIKVNEPSRYRVWMHHDDFTPREFVVSVLESFFSMDRVEAVTVMMEARTKGIAACGKYTKDVALSLLTKAVDYARKYEHPLLYSMEVA